MDVKYNHENMVDLFYMRDKNGVYLYFFVLIFCNKYNNFIVYNWFIEKNNGFISLKSKKIFLAFCQFL
jgi:hypothetical protein